MFSVVFQPDRITDVELCFRFHKGLTISLKRTRLSRFSCKRPVR